jgi:hypothetical protein
MKIPSSKAIAVTHLFNNELRMLNDEEKVEIQY